jgi:hypothetical protein
VEIQLGTNTFIDCETIVAIKGQPLLKVATMPLRLTIVTPSDLPSGRVVHVVENNIEPAASAVRVLARSESVAIFWTDLLIAIATLIDENVVHIHIDFRPLGINIFDDASGLHVGSMHFSRSTMMNSQVAFSLG